MLAAGASALPLEDTPEVVEARAAHLAAVEEAKAGLHAALAPVNNDIQVITSCNIVFKNHATFRLLYCKIQLVSVPLANKSSVFCKRRVNRT